MSNFDLTILIPAYNEGKRIGKTLDRCISYLKKKYDSEIIVVDDGSTDDTKKIVKKLRNMRVGYLRMNFMLWDL